MRNEVLHGSAILATILTVACISNPSHVFAQSCIDVEIKSRDSRNVEFQRGSEWSTRISGLSFQNEGIVGDEPGDKQGAIEDFNQAIKINPRDNNFYLYRGVVRNDLGDV